LTAADETTKPTHTFGINNELFLPTEKIRLGLHVLIMILCITALSVDQLLYLEQETTEGEMSIKYEAHVGWRKICMDTKYESLVDPNESYSHSSCDTIISSEVVKNDYPEFHLGGITYLVFGIIATLLCPLYLVLKALMPLTNHFEAAYNWILFASGMLASIIPLITHVEMQDKPDDGIIQPGLSSLIFFAGAGILSACTWALLDLEKGDDPYNYEFGDKSKAIFFFYPCSYFYPIDVVSTRCDGTCSDGSDLNE